MYYLDDINNFIPYNKQENIDKNYFLRLIKAYPNLLSRENETAHFTASAWVVSSDRSKVLMIWHNTYKSWSFPGGHVDGEADFSSVALREVAEETGLRNPVLIKDGPISLETISVNGHYKHGEYVHSHLHLNLTYLIEGNENEPLSCKLDENSGVSWFSIKNVIKSSNEFWMNEFIYQKLITMF